MGMLRILTYLPYIPLIAGLVQAVESPGNGEAKLRAVLAYLQTMTTLPLGSDKTRAEVAAIVSALVTLFNAFDAWKSHPVVVPPAPTLAFPSNLPIHASVAGQSFVGDKYAVRWTADPRQADEAKAIYAANDVVYHSSADLAGSWYVGPHSLGPAIGDPWKQETYFNGDAIS